MTTDRLTDRFCTAFERVEVPPYPAAFVAAAARASDAAALRPPSRRRPAFALAALTACALAIVIGSAAVAVQPAISDRVLRALDRAGLHLRGKRFIALDVHDASVEEARNAADFTLIVPRNVRIVRTNLATDPLHHHTLIGFVLAYDGRSQIGLDEARLLPSKPGHPRPDWSYRVDANGKVTRERNVVWTIGDAHLMMVPYDAKSRAFAEQVRRQTLADARAAGR